MSTNKSHRKSFTPEEAEVIKRLRKEGKSGDTIAAIMHVGKERLRRFLRENGIDAYQPVKRNREAIDTLRPVSIPYPHFKNPACRGMPIDDFYPGAFSQRASMKKIEMEKVDRTLSVCKSCPEQEKCLDYALIAEPYGIWGGTTEGEREYLRNRLGIACQRDVMISRKSREISNMWQNKQLFGFTNTMKHSEIVEKRLSRRA